MLPPVSQPASHKPPTIMAASVNAIKKQPFKIVSAHGCTPFPLHQPWSVLWLYQVWPSLPWLSFMGT